jgi:uncharacterized protein involved in exopolysaccharide biosynthesis
MTEIRNSAAPGTAEAPHGLAPDPPAGGREPGAPPEAAAEARRRPRRWRSPLAMAFLAALIVALSGGGALGYSLLQPAVYGAESEFVLTPRPELSDAAVDRAMLTHTMLVTGPSVLEPVATQSGIPLGQLQQTVTAEISGRSNILRITTEDRDPSRAVTVTRLVAAEYQRAAAAIPAADPDGPPAIRPALLTAARELGEPVSPRPMRALAAGVLVGVFAAALVLVLVWRPWRLLRPSPYWT